LFLPVDDATVVGHDFGRARGMSEPRLADRVAILETKMKSVDSFLANFDKTLEFRFREQAEMLDQRFTQVHEQMDQNFALVRGDIGAIQKDISILREGMKIILQKLR
jgi:hypothetical protein